MTFRRLIPASATVVLACLAFAACADSRIVAPSSANSALAPRIADAEVAATAGLKQNKSKALKTILKWSPKWTSRDTTIFTITQSGMATGVRVGSAYAVASNPVGRKDSTHVTISAGFAVTVTATIPQTTLAAGQTTQASATAADSAAKTLVGAPITWTTSAATVATVSGNGLVSGVSVGTATIRAASGAASANTLLTVTTGSQPGPVSTVTVTMNPSSLIVGQSVQASAVAKDSQGTIVTGVSFTWSVSSPVILSVSPGGLVSAVAVGTAQVRASVGSVTGSLFVAVNPPPPPPGPNGLTAPPALPQTYLNFPYTPPTGATITVPAGGSLQAAINSAQRGDEIVLPAGATFTGNFYLPVKSGTVANGWITIRTDKLSQLPPEGTRVTPANASLMPKIVTTNTAPGFGTQLGSSGYRLVGLEITVSALYTGPQYGLVFFGDGSSAQRLLSQVATDLVLDRVYVHGQANTTELSRCVSLNSARTQISDSYLSECHSNSIDSQAISGFNGPGPYKIVNNTLIGAGENLMFGGADPWIPGLIPRDIEIRRNYIYTPASWKGVWLKKNLLELKTGQRILVEGNVFDGSWVHGQTGFAIVVKTENQSGGCTWCTSSDITIRYNYIRNAGGGMAITGREGSSPYPIGALSSRISIQNNVMDQINVGIFTGDQRFIQVLGNAQDVDITNNTTTSTGYIAAFLALDNSNSVTRLAYNKNATSLAAYGMIASGRAEGTASLVAVAGGWQFNSNYLIGANRNVYPAGTIFVSSLASVPIGIGADQTTLNAMIAGVIVP